LDSPLATNLGRVRERIERAARRAGRSSADVRLIAVSKTFGPDEVRAAAEAGQVDFGENRVQEALPKIEACGDLPIRWHLVGHLQSNKARKAVGPFASIQSVDSLELLRRIDAAAAEIQAHPEILIQVDLAGEATKHGATPDEVRRILEGASLCRAVRLVGLMLLPPLVEDPEAARPSFREFRAFRDTLVAEGTPASLVGELSMGMSHDFEVAVEEGATTVRVGSAIFGVRHV
jgi:pyridoxal phosphate enzyme (YggS family)